MKKIFALIVLTMLLGSVEMVYAKDWDSCDYVRTYEDDEEQEWSSYDEEFRTYEDDYGSDWDEGYDYDECDHDRYPDMDYYDDESQYEEEEDRELPCDSIEPQYMVAVCRANVRSGPGTCYEIIDFINEGEDVVVIGETYDNNGKHWYKVSDGSFITAGALVTEYEYSARQSECSEKEDSSDEESCTPSCNSVQFYKTVQVGANVRKGPGTCYAVINSVGAGECIGIIDEQDGWYYTDRGGWIAAYLFEEREKEESFDTKFDDYIEVSIDNQMVYVHKHGEIVYSSPCVTGTAGKHDTPRGVFYIQDKQRYAILQDKAGTYSCPVEFWMPFYDGCGTHSSSWRKEYGGEIYLYDGSHGCVNLPYDAAETVYNYSSIGTIVVVH